MKEQILKLRQEGFTYREIQEKVGCCKSTVSYYCGIDQKKKINDRKSKYKLTEKYIIYSKLDGFLSSTNDKLYKKYVKRTSEITKYYNKIIENPYCYLTGVKIDFLDRESFQLDHIIPVSKGGTNDIDNMGLCCKNANIAKSNMTKEELIELCRKIINHNKII